MQLSAGIVNNILSTLPTLENASVDEILDFKKSLKVPLDNFRTAIYNFAEQITVMSWDADFQYECIKLYDTEVMPKVNEINALSSETSVLKNFGSKVLRDEVERRKMGYVGAGLIATIITGRCIRNIRKLYTYGSKSGFDSSRCYSIFKNS